MAMVAHHRHHHPRSYLATAAALFLASTLAPLAAGDPWSQLCGSSGNYTLNSTYQANIRGLAATLPKIITSSSPSIFAKDSFGAVPDVVYALALCRGDTEASACSGCVATAFQDAQKLCAFNKDATVFYDACLLRYSNQNFLPSIGSEFIILTHSNSRNASTSVKNYTAIVVSPANNDGRGGAVILMNTQNVTAPFKVFDTAVAVLLNATTAYAASSSNKFGTGVEAFQTFDSKNPIIYGLAQCTPDMAPADCRNCLSGIIQLGLKYFSGKQGARILGLRCNYRYEQYQFFTGTPLLQLPEPAVGGPARALAPAPALLNGTPLTTGRGELHSRTRFVRAHAASGEFSNRSRVEIQGTAVG